MSWPCRCRRAACQARQTVPLHPDGYRSPRRCKDCKKGLLRVDHYRMKHERGKEKTCNCLGYSFTHRKGSKWCDHNPKMTSEMMEQREGYA